jgi:hypothetical protein
MLVEQRQLDNCNSHLILACVFLACVFFAPCLIEFDSSRGFSELMITHHLLLLLVRILKKLP